eukprot:8442140-Prorocentrum_lima.AAC.1
MLCASARGSSRNCDTRAVDWPHVSPVGWMHILDAKKFCPELTQGVVLRILSRQKDEDKDRFLVLGLAHEDSDQFYPWLIRANHGHTIELDWPRMY